ncbi:trifunctional histidinol dehydrogenase, partial [Coemansia sp. RSA 2598]
MLVPKIAATTVLEPELQRAIDLLPVTLYADPAQAVSAISSASRAGAWACVSPDADVQDLLNSGLSVAVFDSADTVSVDCDKSRIAIRYSTSASNGIDKTIDQALADGVGRAGAVIIQLTSEQLSEATQKSSSDGLSPLARLTAVAEKTLIGTSGPVRVLVDLLAPEGAVGNWTLDLISLAADAGADVIVAAEALAPAKDDSAKRVPLAEAFVAGSGLKSDRSDGLFTTVVVDEQRVCLGVVYSSVESIAAALATGEGVYWSRRRGLWHKGLTSGATQTLVGISVDCDSDALCYRVQQNGAGFCHHSTRSCFGPAAGISQLAQVVAERKGSAPEGSYTARLFSDAQLLRAKLLEEAAELAEATEPADVAFEAADLLYFALTKCAAHGVTLADIERSLDNKHRKV